MMENKQFLGTEPIGPLLRRLAIPTFMAQLINVMYNMVDRMYIGHIPNHGADALTGLGVCVPLILIASAFAAFAANGGAPLSSIAMGRKDYEEAEQILSSCFLLQLCLSVILTTILILFHRPLLIMFGASEQTIGYASDYMLMYSLGTIFVQITMGMNAFITAQGFTRISMLSTLIGAVVNIVLDPIFIFGLGMGVRGAALATVLAQACSSVWVLSFLFGRKTHIRIRREYLYFDRKILLPCFSLGMAVFIANTSESLIFICYNSSLLRYGGDIAVGAMTILMSVSQFAIMPLQGVGQGAQPIISYNFGAGNRERVQQTFRLLITVNMCFAVVMWLCVMLFPQVFAGFFTSDPALCAFTETALRIFFAVLFMFGIQMSCQLTFGALGYAKASIAVAIVRKFVLIIPLIYILPEFFKGNEAYAVYLAEPVADVLAMTFTAILFYFQFKKALNSMEEH